jgi:hypothetical protein
MTLEYIIITILGLLVVILGYTTFNLLRKNEQAEDIIVSYFEYFNLFKETIESSDKRLKEIDERGIFESDDEIGWFFKELKKIQSQISQFKSPL